MNRTAFELGFLIIVLLALSSTIDDVPVNREHVRSNYIRCINTEVIAYDAVTDTEVEAIDEWCRERTGYNTYEESE